MTVEELIEELQKYPPDMWVSAFDTDPRVWYDVKVVHVPTPAGGFVGLRPE